MTKSRHSAWRHGVLLIAAALTVQCSAAPAPSGPPPIDQATVGRLGMYSFGASGVAALPDGRIIIAEDEKRHPFVIVDLFGTQIATEFSDKDIKSAIHHDGGEALNDLEGITIDPRGRLYATTSHAVPRDTVQTRDRTLVVRFEIKGDTIKHGTATSALGPALAQLDASIAESIGKKVKTPTASPGLSIEGIAWDPRSGHLLFGLRGPLRDDEAQVISMDNPDEVFDHAAVPVLSGPHLLNLGGQGIRDLTYDEDIDGFLVVAGASGRSEYGHAELWRWAGPGGPAPVKLSTPVLDKSKPEGVAVVTVRGHRVLVFVCDDGWLDADFYSGHAKVNKGIPSGFAVIPYSVLQHDNPLLPKK